MSNPALLEDIARFVEYNAETGVFVWKVKRNAFRGPVTPGEPAGFVDRTTGYVKIGIAGRHYLAHRLAWFLVHQDWPPAEIDHVDGCRSNNAIANLRLATRQQNACNTRRRADNRSGFRGVSYSNRVGRWLAQINHEGRAHNLGWHDSPEKAAAAYREAATRLHGEFARS